MGSFYTMCSITQQTICDGQEMYVQFMLPANYISGEPGIGLMFRESFLNVVKEKGLDEAIKSFDEATSTWGKEKELSPKGMIIRDSSSTEWVPFGPAIRGFYDDYGNIKPCDDDNTLKRIEILGGLLGGLSLETIMDVATDNRWYTLGLGKYGDSEDKTWRPEGISKDMPEWLLELCKKISVTYIHASVYDELSQFNFSSESKDGIMKSKYDIQWKNEYLDPIKEKFPIVLSNLRITDDEGDPIENMERRWANREIMDRISVFRGINRELGLIYQACIARENPPLDWFYESLIFMYNLSGMCIPLTQSNYGSQHQNWFGWKRINEKLNPIIENSLEDDGYYEEEDDEDYEF
jgi:hypothetical protein